MVEFELVPVINLAISILAVVLTGIVWRAVGTLSRRIRTMRSDLTALQQPQPYIPQRAIPPVKVCQKCGRGLDDHSIRELKNCGIDIKKL